MRIAAAGYFLAVGTAVAAAGSCSVARSCFHEVARTAVAVPGCKRSLPPGLAGHRSRSAADARIVAAQSRRSCNRLGSPAAVADSLWYLLVFFS